MFGQVLLKKKRVQTLKREIFSSFGAFSFIIPPGCVAVTCTLYGAGGGGGTGIFLIPPRYPAPGGGAGATVSATIRVCPYQKLQLYIGKGGPTGTNSGVDG